MIALSENLAVRYYRLALSAASQRNLTEAVRLARYACMFDESHENAARLVKLCMYELGNLNLNPMFDAGQIKVYVKQKKWRKAARLVKSFPHQNVYALNILGCIYACAKRYGMATRFFSQALDKDRGNRLAAAGLKSITSKGGLGGLALWH